MVDRKWAFCVTDREAVTEMAQDNSITRLQAALLYNRGITAPEEIEEFFSCDIDTGIEEPFSLADMDRAVDRIRTALEKNEKICIFGDYDADGVTSTVMIYDYLSKQGANVTWCLPSREEGGYGMHKAIINDLAKDHINLIITVDNGVTAFEEIKRARELGIDVVVTDHHTVPVKLPDCIVIDPHRPDCPSRFKGLCGAGVVFKLICALEEDIESMFDRYGDLLTVATIADIVPLTGENRVFVKNGIDILKETENLGLKALMDKSGMSMRFSVQSVAYMLAPRINSAGRMGDAADSARLLMAKTKEEAEQYAQKLEDYNAKRQQAEQRIFNEANEKYASVDEVRHAPIGVVWGEGWENGVVGIVAAKLVEKYGKPFLVFGIKDGIATGSGRSVESLSIYEAVNSCKELFIKYGGHSQAVGLTISAEKLPDLSKTINDYAEPLGRISPNSFQIDGYLKLQQLIMDVFYQIDELEPFGRENPTPLFCLSGVTIKSIRGMRNGNHCMLEIEKDGASAILLLFGTSQNEVCFSEGDKVDAVVTLSCREFNGNVELSVVAKDIRYTNFDQDNYFNSKFEFDRCIRKGEKPASPITREDTAAIFRTIKSSRRAITTGACLAHILGGLMDYYKISMCLEVLREVGLISMDNGIISLIETTQKKDLTCSKLFRLANDLQEPSDHL
ncbi:MAG TPA: single-stranded-DNA-specific exonuclease RecJ [Oscillospiraceae bacterium]|nr:single-stranded-DNA-specific exonuclease RecJ [Oscillospiraceae bacterium]HPS35260.1 single-stranded-DNA-specific exonuclease RecJ [Oscillospiraceae bacterium]